MGDRANANAPGIYHVVSNGGDVMVRAKWNGLQLYDEQGNRIDLIGYLKQLSSHEVGDLPVFIPNDEDFIAGRICAVKKIVSAANHERERILREASKKCRKVKPQTLEAAGYTFVFTTLDQSIPAKTVPAIYRTRWQIELMFKRLKSFLGLGHLHNKNPESAKAWLHGKLLAACLIEALAVLSKKFSPRGYPLGKKTRAMEEHLEGNRTDVPFLPTSHNASQ